MSSCTEVHMLNVRCIVHNRVSNAIEFKIEVKKNLLIVEYLLLKNGQGKRGKHLFGLGCTAKHISIKITFISNFA